jgi:hypothetical protein
MVEFIDYSSRRGAIVPLLPKIHALLKENSGKDKSGSLAMPENLVIWRQKINPHLLDISWRFLFAMELKNPGQGQREVTGFIFYRYPINQPDTLYIEDMQIAWAKRNDPTVVLGLITKFESDPKTKNAVFFGSERLKMLADKEILAGVGFKETFPDGWEPLGTAKEAMDTLKKRYGRGKV